MSTSNAYPFEAVLSASIALGFCLYKLTRRGNSNLAKIPVIGSSWPILSTISAFRFLFHAQEMLQEGYSKHKGQPFRVPLLDQWLVVVSGPKFLEEFRKASDHELSSLGAANETVQLDHTIGRVCAEDPFHVPIIRSQLTRSISASFPDLRDEIIAAFEDTIKARNDAWTRVPAFESVLHIITRTSNRAFVGLPKCRDKEFVQLIIQFAQNVIHASTIIRWFPTFLKPIAAQLFTNNPKDIRRAMVHLDPIINERLEKLRTYGKDWPERPNDALNWIIEESVARGYSNEAMVRLFLSVEFGAIHTSSISFTHALYHLAANPEYADILREEVQQIVAQEGWTKAAMNSMKKLDSFLRESLRLNGVDVAGMARKAMKDFTFSDGTIIPAGSLVTFPNLPVHFDDTIYNDPSLFNPFRFSDLREGDGEGAKYSAVSTSNDYLVFGHGKHACPGRFFAANGLKAMLAHIVVTYDVKFENEGVRPSNVWWATAVLPHLTAEVMFRKRA